MKIGVLSDTHGHLDPCVLKHFKGVDHILHAGDIGYPSIILELEHIAPVTAVLGNNDYGMDFRETEWITLGDRKFMVHHIVPPFTPDEEWRAKLARTGTNVLVFGHTHKQFAQTFDGVLLFNPGYSGKPRHGVDRSVAIIEVDGDKPVPRFIEL
jgi:putative phosphoesterase